MIYEDMLNNMHENNFVFQGIMEIVERELLNFPFSI